MIFIRLFVQRLCRWLSIFSSGEEEEEMEDFDPTTMLKLFIKYVNSLIVMALEVWLGAGTAQWMVFWDLVVLEAVGKPGAQKGIVSWHDSHHHWQSCKPVYHTIGCIVTVYS